MQVLKQQLLPMAGQGGAAAYAAWATYKATGDVNMALRAGAVAASRNNGPGRDCCNASSLPCRS